MEFKKSQSSIRKWNMAKTISNSRVFSNCWFDSEKCEGGLEALGWYHEKKDEARNIGLGPEHDWASHGSDAFGLMAIVRERPTPKWDKIKYQNQGIV
jgi:phage terminase large subunit